MNKYIHLLLLITIISLNACSQSSADMSSDFERGKSLAAIRDERLKEISGIASSYNNPGFLWAQNDSGNAAEIYLLNQNLDIVFICRLPGIENRDWEDIAVGPGPVPGKSYLYIADIGDNKARHPFKYVYRFEEPKIAEGNVEAEVNSVDRIVFRLSDSIKDTESLMIDHKTKNLYVVSKREEPVSVYELKYPYNTKDTATADKLATLPFTRIVSADYDAATGDVLMKDYEHVYYWKNSHNDDLKTLLTKRPMEVPYEREPQGEAIAWAIDGSGFFTLSEKDKSAESLLYFYKAKTAESREANR